MTSRLPGISRIEFLKAEALTPHIMMRAVAKVPVGIFARLSSVPFDKRNALCEAETEVDNNATLETATLTFRSSAVLPTGRLCFIVSLVNGQRFLMGTRETPFPLIKWKFESGLPDADPNTNTYTISYSNRVALVPISG